MSQDQFATSWAAYYAQTRSRPPRALFIDALDRISQSSPANPTRHAMDLGCGDGTESVILLQQGWQVLAIDQQREALALLIDNVPPPERTRLQTLIKRFEDMILPRADFLYAGLSLPFCLPDQFPRVWGQIERAVSPAGWFAGHFFGERDDWFGTPTMTFLSRDACSGLFEKFVIEVFTEIEKDGATVAGPHHIHAFEVIARSVTG
jgi:tellurite methyltransferase